MQVQTTIKNDTFDPASVERRGYSDVGDKLTAIGWAIGMA